MLADMTTPLEVYQGWHVGPFIFCSSCPLLICSPPKTWGAQIWCRGLLPCRKVLFKAVMAPVLGSGQLGFTIPCFLVCRKHTSSILRREHGSDWLPEASSHIMERKSQTQINIRTADLWHTANRHMAYGLKLRIYFSFSLSRHYFFHGDWYLSEDFLKLGHIVSMQKHVSCWKLGFSFFQ